MNIYNICDNRFALIFQWNADECSMHLLHLHTCCVCSRPEIVTFNKLRIHVPPHPWQIAMCDLSPYPRPTCWSLMLCPPEKQRSIEHVLLECLCCHLWKYDLSCSNELEVTSLNDILAQAEILERICRVVVAWLVCVYSVPSVLGLETWHAAMQKQHPTSKTITGHSAKVRWGWKSPWNMRTESDVGNSYFEFTLRSLWMNEYKSKNLDTDSPDRRPRQRTCCNVLVYCIVFFWTEQGCWQLRFLESIQNFYFTFEDALTWSVIVATRIFTWRFGWLYLKSMWMEQTKRHWDRAWGRRAAGLFSVKRHYTAFWHSQFWSPAEAHQIQRFVLLRCVQRKLCRL